jgi:hypothetical protein
MVDYFFAMSHETIDLTGSQVFGWFTLPKAKTDYAGNVGTPPSGQINRQGLVDLARSTAVSGGVDLTQYYGVVVVMNVLTDLFGGGGRQALCDPGSFEPTVLGQEMGHGYGLAHSRVDGSTGDYQDPWDTMSTWDSCYWADNDQYTLIGPGLNAANMRGQGWLDEVRVWRASSTAFSQEIELRPLHRHDMPGFLAAEVPGTPGGFLVEFRMNEAWDAGFPRSAVLVHRFEDNHSYRMIGIGGHSDLVTGDVFESGSEFPLFPLTRVEVTEINEMRHYAKVRLSHRPAIRIPIPGLGGEVFGGIPVDGDGFIVIGGHVVPVPPRSPITRILEQVSAYQVADQIADPMVRQSAKQGAITAMRQHLEGLIDHLESPPPRQNIKRENLGTNDERG